MSVACKCVWIGMNRISYWIQVYSTRACLPEEVVTGTTLAWHTTPVPEFWVLISELRLKDASCLLKTVLSILPEPISTSACESRESVVIGFLKMIKSSIESCRMDSFVCRENKQMSAWVIALVDSSSFLFLADLRTSNALSPTVSDRILLQVGSGSGERGQYKLIVKTPLAFQVSVSTFKA